MTFCRFTLAALLAIAAPRPLAAQADPRIQVTVVTDEAEAVLAIAERGETADSAQWARLFGSEGYGRLKEREAGMGRAFTDSSFRAFVLSPELRGRVPALRRALDGWRTLDARAAAARAFAYLPPGTVLRARIYPVVKPRTNSFVWDLHGDPAIFFYLDPEVSPAQAENTLAHELHHVGFAQGCPGTPDAATGPERARDWLGGFGEGLAVLAAAGGPNVHPHASSPAAERAVWDRDVAKWKTDFAALERFFLDVAHGRAGSEEETTRRGFTFISTDSIPQGAFYTVGWTMGATIERELGRAALVGAMCDRPALLRLYNRAAARINRRGGDRLPLWSEELLRLVNPSRS
ncbi:MAG: DUF5700 domain-containing putative Zn-dependent protease [Longimicrobiaceae bacterium]